MSKRNQAEELSRAANHTTDVVRKLTGVMSDFLELQQGLERRQRLEWPDERREPHREGLPEELTLELALRTVDEVRDEMGRAMENRQRRPAPSSEEVLKRREDRRKREAEDHS